MEFNSDGNNEGTKYICPTTPLGPKKTSTRKDAIEAAGSYSVSISGPITSPPPTGINLLTSTYPPWSQSMPFLLPRMYVELNGQPPP